MTLVRKPSIFPPLSGFNLVCVLEGAKIIHVIVETWGGGVEGAHLAGQERDW